MAGNGDWAQFATTGTGAKEEQDDDWGDFGGFETAQPVTDPTAINTSGVISWATTFNTQPSLAEKLSPQNNAPPDLSQGTQWAGFPSERPSTTGDPVAVEAKVEQLQNAANLQDSQPQPDIRTMTDDEITGTEEKQQAVKTPVIGDGSLQKHIEETQKASEVINLLEEKVSLAEQEKFKLKEELENLLRKHQELDAVSKTIHENLEEQKQKYKKLQEEHHQQVQEMRQAGHDALAIIVEEYKELSRQAVLEEREKNQVELHNFLEDERRKFQDVLSQQKESFERTLTEEREKNDERVKALVEEEQQKHKLAIESALSKERAEFKDTLEMAIKETREEGEKAVKAAVCKEKEIHLALMEKMENTMEEEREKFRRSIKEALDDERQQSKKATQEAIAEECTKSRETVKKSVEETKTLMNEYVTQKQEMDTQVQQKQYVVMDLFLESARTQLKNLMDSNQKT